ncbi:MAG: peptidoglycan DD-metalloendopeptidase family protein [Desulfobacteraceae bacterium]|nr:peptidoglycan DD-metalloendopeptidase family protein [Desulfobacteraceae bacterium]
MPRPGASFLTVMLLLPAVAAFSGQGRAAGPVENLENRLSAQQQQMQRLSQGIQAQKGMLRESRQQELQLLSLLERLEQELKDDRTRLAATKDELDVQEQLLATHQARLDEVLREQEGIAVQIKKRLAAYYRMGGVGVLNALFSTTSLPDLLDMEEYLTRLVAHDRQTLTVFRNKIAEVNGARQEVAAQKERLAALYQQLQQQEQQTAATEEQQLALLRQVRTERKLHQRAVSEMEQDASRLTATLNKLREEAPAPEAAPATAGPSPAPQAESGGPPVRAGSQSAPTGGQGLAASKGRLPPPVAGTVLTRFGEEVPGQFGIAAKATGIDIKTKPGAPIKAVHAGKVVYAGYLRGYGNLLIIDHGRQYYSLMSRAARFVKGKGDEVQTGEVVGVMGDAAELPPEGLHFEIRHGSEPEDPLSWLDPGQMPATGKVEKIRPDFTSLNRR